MAEYKSQKAGPGAVIFFATVALIFLVLAVGKLPLFNKTRDVTLYFEGVSGVKERSAVAYAGRKCGMVKSLRVLNAKEAKTDANGKRYFVEMVATIDANLSVTTDSKVSIEMLGALGDKQVNLLPGDPGSPDLPADGFLLGENVGIDQIIANVRRIMPKLQTALDNASGLLANVNDVVKDPVFKENIKETIVQAKSTLEKADATMAQVKEILGENRDNIKSTLANSRDLTEKAKGTMTAAEQMMNETRPKLQITMENVQKLTEQLRPQLEELMTKANTTMDKAGTTLDTAKSVLGDNRENLTMLTSNLRETGYNTKHVTHTLRLIFAPWSIFSSQKPAEKAPARKPNTGGAVKVLTPAPTTSPAPATSAKQ